MARFFDEKLVECKSCKGTSFSEKETFAIEEMEMKHLITKDKLYARKYKRKEIYCINCGEVLKDIEISER